MTQPEGIDITVLPSGGGGLECERGGTWWSHLRRCAQCGHIGCCDSSPSQHAPVHARSSGHPLITSFEPGEDWFYDYRDKKVYDGQHLAPPEHHHIAQPTPGPAGGSPRTGKNTCTEPGTRARPDLLRRADP